MIPLRVIAFEGGHNLPIWAAQRQGLFHAAGVDVALAFTPSSTALVAAMFDGAYDIAALAFDNVVAYQEGQGEAQLPGDGDPDLFAFLGVDDGLLALTTAPAVARLADLAGKTLSVDAMTTGFAFVLRELVERAGLAGAGIRIASAGGTGQRYRDLIAGVHDGTLLRTPFELLAADRGCHVLATADGLGPYLGTVAAARRSWARAHEPALLGFIRGFRAGLDWAAAPEHRASALALLTDHVRDMTPELAGRSYDALLAPGRGLIRDLALDPARMRTVLALRSKFGEPRRLLDVPTKYIDASYRERAFAAWPPASQGAHMAHDARVASAIAHWAPRFVSNGVLLQDFQEVTAGLERWDDWCRAWSARAAVHESLGQGALAQGHRFTASEHLTRAGVYYHFAKFMFVNDRDQMRAAHARAIACRQAALPHLHPPGERIEIPYQGSRLAAILRRPTGAVRPPVVIMVPGLDSAKEEFDSYETTFLARGMATLSVDGPGQGEAEYEFPIRGDYEVAVSAMLDGLAGRSDVDAARVGLWGVSIGGYYAPRAAAFERRLRACIALAGPYDLGDIWDGLPELTQEAFRARSHHKTLDEARRFASTLSLKGIARQIECPLFLVAGKRDRIIPWQDAERLAGEVSGPVELLVIEDGNHVANNRPYRYRPQTADWMAAQLGASADRPTG